VKKSSDSKPKQSLSQRANWLRAAILGVNDGIVSTSSIMLGVSAAAANSSATLTAGIAGVVAGALSMAAGEYVSVSSQRDSEKLSGKKHEELVSPLQAALASAASFVIGGIIPIIAALVASDAFYSWTIVIFSVVALAASGAIGAVIGGGNRVVAALRVLIGGSLAMAITALIGHLVGSSL